MEEGVAAIKGSQENTPLSSYSEEPRLGVGMVDQRFSGRHPPNQAWRDGGGDRWLDPEGDRINISRRRLGAPYSSEPSSIPSTSDEKPGSSGDILVMQRNNVTRPVKLVLL